MTRTQYHENILMGLHTLRSHKLRSFLTVLGVIIGVVTVIVIASLLTGMRSSIVSMVEDYGTNNIYAFHLSTGPQLGPRDRREWQRKPLTLENAMAIQQQAESVDSVGYEGFSFFDRPLVQYRDQTYRQSNVVGASPNFASVVNLPLDEGRFITDFDELHRTQVIVLGVNVVEALFPHHQRVIGHEVLLNGKGFTIVGTLAKRKSTFFGSSDEDNVAYIPYRTLRKMLPRNDFLMILIKAKPDRLREAWDEAEAILRRERGVRFNEDNNFDLTTADRLVEQFDGITATIGLIAIAISGVGLLVGGIGVMNIMLVSVTERTREIGVRKAVGAKRQDIVFQFLFEAMTMTTVGGLVGVVFSILASYLLIWIFPSMPASIPLWAVVSGLTVSTSVGLIFGVWPAVKASRLDPIECLRYE